MGIVIHDDEILEFEVHKGNVVHKGIPTDEFSKEIFGLMEMIVAFEKLLETAVFLDLLESDAFD